MPDPTDDKSRDMIKEAIKATAQGIKETAASVMTLGAVAGFDTTEIHPDIREAHLDASRKHSKEKEKAEALKNELEYQGQEEEDDEVPFEDDPEPEYEDITPGLNSNEDPEQEEEPGPKESKPMNVQELLAKLKNRRDKDDENGG